MRALCRVFAAAVAFVASTASAQSCYTWSRAFTGQDFNAPPLTSIVFNDGSGPKLFMAGQFQQAGGLTARSIARLDPNGWNSLGSGTSPSGGSVGVYALAVFDEDGAGPGLPALYAGGLFDSMNGVASRAIAKWNGTTWQPVGSPIWGSISSLAVHDDGTGPHLYAGGAIQLVNGGTPYGLVKLSGGVWSVVPEWNGGVNVKALASHDDGHGSALYAAVYNGTVYRLASGACVSTGAATVNPAFTGCFATFADNQGSRLYYGAGHSGNCFAAWDGSSWTTIQNPGTSFGGMGVQGLTVWDDGTGSALYVMGELQGSPDPAMSGIAKYRNGQWSALGTGLTGSTRAHTAQPIQDEGQTSLFVAGYFTSAGGNWSRYTAVWTGAEWKARGRAQLGSGIASAQWDDGSGSRTYAATTPTTGSGSVSVWDGTGWANLPGGVNSGITQMAGVSGGSTPGLYVTGPFGRTLDSSGQEVAYADGIARWDGSSWSGLGGFFRTSGSGRANALCVADTGDGPALYVGGEFDGVGGSLSANVGVLGGGTWSALGLGTNNPINGMIRFNDGSGMATYVTGFFNQAGGQPALWVARWNGVAWAAVSSGLNGPPRVFALHDDGAGVALYAGGTFDFGLGTPAVAKWNGTSWQPVGAGGFASGSVIYCLLSKNGPGGPKLYAGGNSSDTSRNPRPVVVWNGTAWSPVGGSEMGGEVLALGFHDDGSGEQLYAAGRMNSQFGGVARLISGVWQPIGSLGSISGNGWYSMASYDSGTGAKLYVGGDSNVISSLNTRNSLLCWNGSSWSVPAGGIPYSSQNTPIVNELVVHDDGNGARLVAAGRFGIAGTSKAMNVASFDGTSWLPMLGTSGLVNAAVTGSESGVPKLWLAGNFFVGGITPASNIARYKDGQWQTLGTGTNDYVMSLAAHDEGSGTRVFAGGYFQSVGGVSASRIARWDGTAWSSLGSGCDNSVLTLVSHGGSLYAGGVFQSAGGVSTSAVARWDGSAWSGVGGGMGGGSGQTAVNTFSVMDDGAGPALFAAGEFTSAGGGSAARAAKWDGSSWSGLAAGLNGTALSSSVIPTAAGPAMAIKGSFTLADGWQSVQVAAWQPCASRAEPPCPADFNGDGFLDGFDYDDFVICFEGDGCPAGKSADFNGDGFADGFDYDDFVTAFETGC